METVVKIENLHFCYPGDETESLRGIDLEIEKGSFVAVLGHNGSGKSTLAKHLNAILVPTEGKVTVCGIDTADEDKLIEANCGLLSGLLGLVSSFGHLFALGAHIIYL